MTNEERALSLVEEMIDHYIGCDGMGYYHEIEDDNEITIDEAMRIIREKMGG